MANDSFTDALRVTQDSLVAFQRMQEQTAQLHRQFLESQESAQRTLQMLVEGQQRLLAASLGMPVATVAPTMRRRRARSSASRFPSEGKPL